MSELKVEFVTLDKIQKQIDEGTYKENISMTLYLLRWAKKNAWSKQEKGRNHPEAKRAVQLIDDLRDCLQKKGVAQERQIIRHGVKR